MANDKKPQCSRCFGTNWIDLGNLEGEKKGNQTVHFYQCGGGNAHADSEDMKQGCMRVIRATSEEMTKGGTI